MGEWSNHGICLARITHSLTQKKSKTLQTFIVVAYSNNFSLEEAVIVAVETFPYNKLSLEKL